MLNDVAMKTIGDSVPFAEDEQCIYVDDTLMKPPYSTGTQAPISSFYVIPRYTGTNANADVSGTTLTDGSASFTATLFDIIGRVVKNTTTGATAVCIARNSSTSIEHTQLTGGSRQTWVSGDNWEVTDFGMAEWMEANNGNTYPPNPGFNTGYRDVENADHWMGSALAMAAMNLQPFWNDDAYFDYMERYRLAGNTTAHWRGSAYTSWIDNMFDQNFPFST
jgi:hypothetical protein